jgi:hypothetical protein
LLQQLNDNYGDADLIPIVWDSDDQFGDPRYSWYPGDGYLPWITFGGYIQPTWNSYAEYESAYNTLHAQDSALDIALEVGVEGNELVATATIEVTDTFTANSPKVWLAVTHYRSNSDADYVYAVEDYSGETDFDISQIGETDTFTHSFAFQEDWSFADMKVVCVVQSWVGASTKPILQGAQFSFEPNATITGTVTDDFNGAPLEGAIVTAAGSYIAETAADGTYTVDVYAHTLDVAFDYPGYTSGLIEDLNIAAGETVSDIDFSLVEELLVPIALQAELTDVITLDWEAPGAAALSEDFESGDWPPAGWEEYQLNQAGGWEQGGGHNSDYSAHHEDISGVASEDWLVSPQIPVGGILTFWEKNEWMANYYEYHGIWVSTGSSDPQDGEFIEVAEYDVEAADWAMRTLDLTAYTGTFYLAFKYIGTYATDWYVDDIEMGFSQSREHLGYNVYETADMDNPLNGGTPVEVTSYVVGDPPDGSYTYAVTAVFTAGESLPSNEVAVVWDPEGVDNMTPLTTALQTNYPNPFNPVTRIDFSLAEPTQVTVEVFNLTGQLVTTLVDDFRQAGEYSVSWDAGNVTSGLYMYRMQTTDFSLTRKMTLIK